MIRFNVHKFLSLRRRRDDVFAARTAASDECRALHGEIQQLEGEIVRLRQHPPVQAWRTTATSRAPGAQGPTQHQVRVDPAEPLEAEIATLRLRLADARTHRDRIHREAEEIGRLVSKLEEHLSAAGIKVDRLLPDRTAAPARRSGPLPTVADVDALRGQIREARAEQKRVERAATSQGEAHDRIDAWLDAAAGSLDLQMGGFIGAEPGKFHLFGRDEGLSAANRDRQMVEALFSVTSAPKLRATLRAAAVRAAEGRGGWGLPTAERRTRLAELAEQLFDLEVREERMIEALEGAGVMVARRPDADPRAVLAIVEAPDLVAA